MDTIKLIIGFLIKLAIVLVLIIAVWWLVSSLYPDLKYRNLLGLNSTSTRSAGDWLPPPGSFRGIFGTAKTPDANTNVYQGGNEYQGGNVYNGSGNQYRYGMEYNSGSAAVQFITYDSSGKEVVLNGNSQNKPPTSSTTTTTISTPSTPPSTYVRNISVSTGSSIFKGLTITGEARTTMFKDGRFPTIVVSNQNKIVSVNPSDASPNWSVPGWDKFEVKIKDILPSKTPCLLVFQSANTSTVAGTTTPQYIKVSIPVVCN
ncbi:MAG: hypothetical protein JWN37_597 [Candidatus Nomurabacteria bacterium]|nr:hypothetical protein [Candidatus Nomurabacteria bacterium]